MMSLQADIIRVAGDVRVHWIARVTRISKVIKVFRLTRITKATYYSY